MGRASGKNRGRGGGSPDGSRGTAATESLPLPDRDSVIIGFGDDHTLAYYSPRENKFLEVETDIEILVDGKEDFDEDDFQVEIASLEEELIHEAKKNLLENGEVGFTGGERKAEVEKYLGPTYDGMDQRWEEREVSVEMTMSIPEGSEIYDISDNSKWIENINPPQYLLKEFHARRAREAEETGTEQSSTDTTMSGGIFSEENKRDVKESLDGLTIRKPLAQSAPEFEWDDVGEGPANQVPTEFPEFGQDGIKTPGAVALADLPDGGFATDADGKLYRKMGAGSVQGSAVIEGPGGDLWQQDTGTILKPSTLRRRPMTMQDGEEIPSKATTYAERVAELENEDMTTSDAQGIADGEGWADDPMARAEELRQERETCNDTLIGWMIITPLKSRLMR